MQSWALVMDRQLADRLESQFAERFGRSVKIVLEENEWGPCGTLTGEELAWAEGWNAGLQAIADKFGWCK